MANEVRTGVHNSLAYKTIDYVHQECHVGQMNYANYSIQTLAANASANVLICTNSSKEVHLGFEIAANGPLIFKFYESTFPAASSYGNVLSPICMNRNFTTSAGTVFYVGTVMTNGLTIGTSLVTQLIVGDTGGGLGTNSRVSIGGTARNNVEWILKPNTNYLASLVNTAGVVIGINVETEFYEE